MRDIDGIEKVIEKLNPHWAEIDKRFEEENKNFKDLLKHDHDDMGRVLKCHLIVEHYLDRFLKDHFLIENIAEVKLTFFQKAKLLPNEGAAASFVKPGILNLNSIRNKFSHTLNYRVGKNDLPHIYEVLRIAREGVVFEAVDALEAFTTVACTWLIIPPPHLQKIFLDAFSAVKVNVSD